MNQRGQYGEDAACQWLVAGGYNILERNFRFRFGEVDIIAERKGVLFFIEVKNWLTLPVQELEFSVNKEKLQKLRNTAMRYLHLHEDRDWKEIDFRVMFCPDGNGKGWQMISNVVE